MTIGAVAEHFGCRPWQVRRLYESGRLPPAARVGAYRIIDPADLPRIETELLKAGYIKPAAEVVNG
jgi:DNA-binding transcriptional MerR regulator